MHKISPISTQVIFYYNNNNNSSTLFRQRIHLCLIIEMYFKNLQLEICKKKKKEKHILIPLVINIDWALLEAFIAEMEPNVGQIDFTALIS